LPIQYEAGTLKKKGMDKDVVFAEPPQGESSRTGKAKRNSKIDKIQKIETAKTKHLPERMKREQEWEELAIQRALEKLESIWSNAEAILSERISGGDFTASEPDVRPPVSPTSPAHQWTSVDVESSTNGVPPEKFSYQDTVEEIPTVNGNGYGRTFGNGYGRTFGNGHGGTLPLSLGSAFINKPVDRVEREAEI
jgi:hypothetical protein